MNVEPNFKREPIRSRKLMDSARGQPCTLQFLDVCNHDPATTVSCHLHDETFGMGRKADDFDTVHGCSACHMFLDHGWVGKISLAELLEHIVRAIQRTLRKRIERGLIVVPIDPPVKPRPIKPRKPPGERAPVPAGRPLDARSNPAPNFHKVGNSNPVGLPASERRHEQSMVRSLRRVQR